MDGSQLAVWCGAVCGLSGVASVAFFCAAAALPRQPHAAHVHAVPAPHAAAVLRAYVASVVALSATWWCASISLVLLNRFVYGYSGLAWRLPALISTLHLGIKATLALGATLWQEARLAKRVRETGLRDEAYDASESVRGCWGVRRWLTAALIRQRIDRVAICTVIFPSAACAAADIVLSAWALSMVPVNVYTVTKSSALVMTLLLSLALRMQPCSWRLMACVAATFTGVLLTLVKPDVPDAWGVCVTLLAAFSSSLRWVLNEKYFVQRHTGGAPPNVMVLTMVQGALGMLVLMPFAVNDTLRLAGSHMTAQQSGAFASLILVGGLLASVLLLVELALVSMTSALTLTVIGQLKDIMAILLSVAIYSEIVTPLNAVGIGLVCASTVVYARLRTAPKSKAAMAAAEGEVAGMPPRAARRKHRVCVCCPWRRAPAARAAVSRGPASQNAAPVPGERSRGHAVDMAPCQELSRAGALGDTAGAAALEGDDDGFDDELESDMLPLTGVAVAGGIASEMTLNFDIFDDEDEDDVGADENLSRWHSTAPVAAAAAAPTAGKSAPSGATSRATASASTATTPAANVRAARRSMDAAQDREEDSSSDDEDVAGACEHTLLTARRDRTGSSTSVPHERSSSTTSVPRASAATSGVSAAFSLSTHPRAGSGCSSEGSDHVQLV